MVEPRWCGWWRGHRRHAERRISSSSGGDGHGLRLGVRISVGIVASEVRGRSGGGVVGGRSDCVLHSRTAEGHMTARERGRA
jgi:hypothetical protein